MAEQQIKNLHYKRGSLKTRMTLFKKFIDKCQTAVTEGNEVDTTQIDLRLVQITNILTDFDVTQTEIESIDGNFDAGLIERELFEDLYFEYISKAKAMLSTSRSDVESENGSVRSSQNSPFATTNGVKLPQIELPKFRGEYDAWLEFRDTFKSLIEDNPSIGNIQKFHYLRASLGGEAARIIQNIKLSDSNYAIAWELLCNRFNNEEVLIDHHVKALLNLPQMTRESPESLRQLADSVAKHTRSLVALDVPVDQWDVILICLICERLDTTTLRDWEKYKADHDKSLDSLLKFLENKADLLVKLSSKGENPVKTKTLKKSSANASFASYDKCVICKDSHSIFACKEFEKLTPKARESQARQLKLCINCLRPGHLPKFCRSGSCRKCKGRHHTLLHYDAPNDKADSTAEHAATTSSSNQSCVDSSQTVLLSTALVNIPDAQGHFHTCKALLDSGSQSNFISERLCNKLGLKKVPSEISIIGINHHTSNLSHRCDVTIHSLVNKFSSILSCFIVPRVTQQLPNIRFETDMLDIPSNVTLADPGFNEPSEIDLLIGASIFWKLLKIGRVTLGPQKPLLQKTALGWIISGPLNISSNSFSCNFSLNQEKLDLNNQLTKFWEIEDFSQRSSYTDEENSCEAHFAQNFQRNEEERFVVSIPFKYPPMALGDSRSFALKRFYALERRLQSNDLLLDRYTNFLSEYQNLGHMSLLESDPPMPNFFLAHHGVMKEESATTKLRVVFNGSAPSETGWSLNSLQMVGPTIQQDLLSILLRFRQYKFVVSADIQKMYRQIQIAPNDRKFQLILWRSNPSDELQTFQLNTVTYGTASASFLAIRCLAQLAVDNKSSFPKASQVIQDDFYVDDLLTGSDTAHELIQTSLQVTNILRSAGFPLRKWISNDQTILDNLANEALSIRCAIGLDNCVSIELHGFCDASQEAYGGCLFLRCTDAEQNVQTRLLCSKSKVAPLKSLSIPKLELCGALLLSQLFEKVVNSSRISFQNCIFWTDSTIVLGWISTPSNMLKTFVSNRVAEVQRITKSYAWKHVPTKDNPADYLSRGVKPENLISLQMWWSGPKWLTEPSSEWPNLISKNDASDLPETKKLIFYSLASAEVKDFRQSLFQRYSQLSKLLRVLALCRRFSDNCRKKPDKRANDLLTVEDLDASLKLVIKMVQQDCFPDDLNDLTKNGCCKPKSKIFALAPFLDTENIIRVGGRLRNSQFSYNKKHPMLLPASHPITKLIFEDQHHKNLHCGPSALLGAVRERFWPIAGRNMAKFIVRKCIVCYRFSAKTLNPIMANLPRHRIEPTAPFTNSGVDYVGPFRLKDRKGRGCKISKCYVCLFVCFATKAVHLELASELSTEVFLSAFRRFASRRGKPRNLYSDNGTNFVGANHELKDLYVFLQKSYDNFHKSFLNDNTAWHFIPASSPHFGGLWEAGVKSTKFHLKRVMGDALLTYEEFNTLLNQIECILNSRPIHPLSSEPSDLEALTPSHFLIGRRLTAVPDVNYVEVPINRLSRWQYIQSLQQHFWSRWSLEYISELQTRSKWKASSANIAENNLVLIKDDNLSPTHWRLGRIVSLHPGEDGVVRVVSVRTCHGVFKRAVRKLCPLPIANQDI